MDSFEDIPDINFCETPPKKKVSNKRKNQNDKTDKKKKNKKDNKDKNDNKQEIDSNNNNLEISPDRIFVDDTPEKTKNRLKSKSKFNPYSEKPWFPFLDSIENPDEKPVLHQWYSIKRSLIGNEETDQHIKKLSVTGTKVNYISGELPDPTIVFLFDPKWFHLPKYYAIEFYKNRFSHLDYERRGLDCENLIYDETKPLDEVVRKQESAFNAIHKSLVETGGALLALPPGDGKTTVALYTLSKLKKKTLVAVPSNPILTQWKDRIKTYLPKAKVGQLQANIYDYKDKDIVLTTLQSLYTGKYTSEILDEFGCFIIDEAHKVSARCFSRSLGFGMCKYVLALSGTPNRKDNSDVVLSHFIGPVTFQTKRTYVSRVIVKVIEPEYPPIPDQFNFLGKHDFTGMMNDLTLCPERNNAVVDQIMDCIRTGNQTLVFSTRRNHLGELHNMVEERIKKLKAEKKPLQELKSFQESKSLSESNSFSSPKTEEYDTVKDNQELNQEDQEQEDRIDPNDLLDWNVSIGFILGGNTKANRIEQERAKTCQLIFSTYHMSGEALDIPSLRIVIFAAPKPDVVQCAARVMRVKNASVEPLIIDILDRKSIWRNFWYQRRQFYIKEKFYVEMDGKLMDPIEFSSTRKKDSRKKQVDDNEQKELQEEVDCEISNIDFTDMSNIDMSNIDFTDENLEENGLKFKKKRKFQYQPKKFYNNTKKSKKCHL